MELILLIIAIGYCVLYLVLFIGTLRSQSLVKYHIPDRDLPTVSIILSAKNEENNIGLCLESLTLIEYPKENLEIFIIDNDSTDNTAQLMQNFADQHDNVNFFSTKPDDSGLKGKIQAISQGIDRSKGEFIFTTDADCCVKPSWVKETLSYYDNRTGIVNGFTLMMPNSFMSGLQSLDWLYMLLLCSSSAGLGKPISCVGNNMSYRRTAYDEVGGYRGIPFSVTEDFMLQKMIDKKTSWKVKYPIDNKCLNISIPCKTIGEISRQKHRWGVGGLNMRPWGAAIGLISWLGSMLLMLGWIFLTWKAYLTFVIVKLAVDMFYYLPAVGEFKMYKLFLYFIPFQFYVPLYSTILFISLLFNRKVIWKKERYN